MQHMHGEAHQADRSEARSTPSPHTHTSTNSSHDFSLQCQHILCSTCLPSVLRAQGKCPQCREPLIPDTDGEDADAEPIAEPVEMTATEQWDALLDVAREWAEVDKHAEDDVTEASEVSERLPFIADEEEEEAEERYVYFFLSFVIYGSFVEINLFAATLPPHLADDLNLTPYRALQLAFAAHAPQAPLPNHNLPTHHLPLRLHNRSCKLSPPQRIIVVVKPNSPPLRLSYHQQLPLQLPLQLQLSTKPNPKTAAAVDLAQAHGNHPNRRRKRKSKRKRHH